MPKDYIARLVYDRTHLSMAIVKKPLEVVGSVPHHQTFQLGIANFLPEVSHTAPSRKASLPK